MRKTPTAAIIAPYTKLTHTNGPLLLARALKMPVTKCMRLCAHRESPRILMRTFANCFDFIFLLVGLIAPCAYSNDHRHFRQASLTSVGDLYGYICPSMTYEFIEKYLNIFCQVSAPIGIVIIEGSDGTNVV
jgi:hypothetical protein